MNTENKNPQSGEVKPEKTNKALVKELKSDLEKEKADLAKKSAEINKKLEDLFNPLLGVPKNRQLDGRKKILLGTFLQYFLTHKGKLISASGEEISNKEGLISQLDKYLGKNNDRAIFGLEPRAVKPKKAKPKQPKEEQQEEQKATTQEEPKQQEAFSSGAVDEKAEKANSGSSVWWSKR